MEVKLIGCTNTAPRKGWIYWCISFLHIRVSPMEAVRRVAVISAFFLWQWLSVLTQHEHNIFYVYFIIIVHVSHISISSRSLEIRTIRLIVLMCHYLVSIWRVVLLNESIDMYGIELPWPLNAMNDVVALIPKLLSKTYCHHLKTSGNNIHTLAILRKEPAEHSKRNIISKNRLLHSTFKYHSIQNIW